MSTSVPRYSAENDEVVLEVCNKVGVVTLNRPKALNALNLNMIRTMYPVLSEWEKDPNVQLIIMKGSGEKAFCAGGDVRAVAKSRDLSRCFFPEEYHLNNLIGILKTPFIALIDGITMGGGVGLSVHGRYRIATERTLFAMPETALGLHPDVGGSFFLPRMKNNLGMFLALTGHRLKSKDVYFSGVATHYVESGCLKEIEVTFKNKEAITAENVEGVLNQFHKQYEGGEFSLASHLEQINKCFGGKSVEEIFMLLKEDGSEWALKYLNLCQKMSPSSMKVSHRAILEGGKMQYLADALQMENRISQEMMERKDFYEGVRAILVDRDNNAKWDPATLEEVTDEIVSAHFQPLGKDDIHLPKQ